jgi:hypothetical protein
MRVEAIAALRTNPVTTRTCRETGVNLAAWMLGRDYARGMGVMVGSDARMWCHRPAREYRQRSGRAANNVTLYNLQLSSQSDASLASQA